MAGYDDDDSDYTWVTCDGSSSEEDGSVNESSSDGTSSSEDDSSSSASSSSNEESSSSEDLPEKEKEDDHDETKADTNNMTNVDVPIQLVETGMMLDDLSVKESTSHEAEQPDTEPKNQLRCDCSDRRIGESPPTKERSILVVLCCMQSSDRELTTRQNRAHALLLAHNIPYEAIDGSDPANAEARDDLFRLSGCTGQYPLFFRRMDDGTFEYIGNYDTVEWSNELGRLNRSMSTLEAPDAAEYSDGAKLERSVPAEDATATASPRSVVAAERAVDDKAETKARARRAADDKVARVKHDAEELAKQLEHERRVAEKLANAHHEAMETLERERQEQDEVRQRQAAEQALREQTKGERRVKEAEEKAMQEKCEAEEFADREISRIQCETELAARINEEARVESERLEAERRAKETDDRAQKVQAEAMRRAEDEARQQRQTIQLDEERLRHEKAECEKVARPGQREVKEPDASKHRDMEALVPHAETDVASEPTQEQENVPKMVEVAQDAAPTVKRTKSKPDRARGDQVRRKSHRKASAAATGSGSRPKASGERQTSGKMFLRLPKAKPEDAAAVALADPRPPPAGPAPTEAERRRAALRRLQRCYEWYGKLGQPTRDRMRERVARIHASVGVTPADVDAMPWTATGRLNVVEMNRIFLQQV